MVAGCNHKKRGERNFVPSEYCQSEARVPGKMIKPHSGVKRRSDGEYRGTEGIKVASRQAGNWKKPVLRNFKIEFSEVFRKLLKDQS